MLLLADASDLKKIDIRNLRGSEMTEENLYKIYRNGLFLPLVLNSRSGDTLDQTLASRKTLFCLINCLNYWPNRFDEQKRNSAPLNTFWTCFGRPPQNYEVK